MALLSVPGGLNGDYDCSDVFNVLVMVTRDQYVDLAVILCQLSLAAVLRCPLIM